MHFDEVVEPAVLDAVLDAARRGPSAGHSQGVDLVVLEGAEQTSRYWDLTLPADRRPGFPWPGLLRAPVLVVIVAAPGAYVARYGEPDKADSGLGSGAGAWPVPFWFVDGGAAAMALLYGATAHGLGALLFGVFEHEEAVMDGLGVPGDRRIVAVVALGHADGDDRPSGSVARGRRPAHEVIHRGGW